MRTRHLQGWKWMVGGLLVLILGGPFSILLTVVMGVPVDRVLSVLSEPSWGGYAVFLATSFTALLIVFALSVLFWYGLARLVGAQASFEEVVGVTAYAATPAFIAGAIPQVLVVDTVGWNPFVQLVVSYWNMTVDLVQLGSSIWVLVLMYLAARIVWGLPRFRSVIFAVPPWTLLVVGAIVSLFFL